MNNPNTHEVDSTKTGREIYEKLEQSGALKEHQGKMIWIHPETGLYVIGGDDVQEAAALLVRELLAKVKALPGYADKPDNNITSTFCSRRIGGVCHAPGKRSVSLPDILQAEVDAALQPALMRGLVTVGDDGEYELAAAKAADEKPESGK